MEQINELIEKINSALVIQKNLDINLPDSEIVKRLEKDLQAAYHVKGLLILLGNKSYQLNKNK